MEPQLAAERADHSVAVLFRVYAKFLKGGDEAANAKISALLQRRKASPAAQSPDCLPTFGGEVLVLLAPGPSGAVGPRQCGTPKRPLATPHL